MAICLQMEHRPGRGAHSRPRQRRPSILDLASDAEPWLDDCRCTQTLVLFVEKRPIALIGGTPLDHAALDGRLQELRRGRLRR